MKTDSQLQQDVIAELKWEPSVDATEIGVEVKDGIVTLAGHVSSYAEKWHAERAAQRVEGVKALAVEMNIVLAGPSARSDSDIARTVEHALEWVSYIPRKSIKIMVEGGWVTLSGEVQWDYQRQIALSAVRYLMGVRGVSDTITIKSASRSDAVKADIEAALKRRTNGNAGKVSVEVHGADVTLTGTVHNWWERELARESAWSAPGVHSVVDKMTLSY
jgi:osmotically-inducible protein OsmY